MRDEKIKPDFIEIDPGPVKQFIKNARAFIFEGEGGAQVRVILSRDAGLIALNKGEVPDEDDKFLRRSRHGKGKGKKRRLKKRKV